MLASIVRRALCVLLSLALCLLVCPFPSTRAATVSSGSFASSLPTVPLQVGSLSAKSAVLIDADSGRILYGKDETVRLPMASTTKIMTALCAVELCSPDRIITVDPAAVGIEGSSVYLHTGEQLTLLQLLYALLLESANDAAAAIAIGVAGSTEAFVARMNQKATALGLKNTHFENPHGLDGETHYTTAYDLALIARAALAHPLLKTVMSTRKITIPLDGGSGVRLLVNHNKLLRSYEGAIGVKTGFTKKSGRCLVSAAERDGLCLIAVTLSAPDDWNDHRALLDAGFATYEKVELCGKDGFLSPLPVVGGCEDYVLVKGGQTAALTLPRQRGTMLCTVELPRFTYAPVAADETVGRLIFRCDIDGDGTAEPLATVPLLTSYAMERQKPLTLWQRILRFLHIPND